MFKVSINIKQMQNILSSSCGCITIHCTNTSLSKFMCYILDLILPFECEIDSDQLLKRYDLSFYTSGAENYSSLTHLLNLLITIVPGLARHGHWCNSGIHVLEVTKHFLIIFKINPKKIELMPGTGNWVRTLLVILYRP